LSKHCATYTSISAPRYQLTTGNTSELFIRGVPTTDEENTTLQTRALTAMSVILEELDSKSWMIPRSTYRQDKDSELSLPTIENYLIYLTDRYGPDCM